MSSGAKVERKREPDFEITRGDTLQPIEDFLVYTDGRRAQNLAGATVLFKYKPWPNSSGAKHAVTADLVSAGSAHVRYEWQAADTTVAGDYDYEWEVTRTDGSIETFPLGTKGYLKIWEDV